MAKYILKKDRDQRYFWALLSDKDDEVLAASGQTYASRKEALDAIEWTRANAKNAILHDAADLSSEKRTG